MKVPVVATLCLLPLLNAGCQQQPAAGQSTSSSQDTRPAGAKPPGVSVITVPDFDIVRRVEMPGTVEGFETAALYSKVGGYVQEFVTHPETGEPINIGDRVTQGQALAQLSAPEMHDLVAQKQALVEQARADVEEETAAINQAEAKLNAVRAGVEEARTELAEKEAQLQFRAVERKRYENLVKNNSVRRELLEQAEFQHQAAKSAVGTAKARIRTAQAELASSQADLAKARADLKSSEARVNVAESDADYAQTMMKYATIRAPFDGVITKRPVDRGAFVQPAEGNSAAKPILSIVRTDIVRIFVDIPMTDAALVDRGDKATFDRIPALPGASFPGTATRFSPSLGAGARLLKAEIDLDNSDGRLLPGYYGYMTVQLEEQPDTPVIPSSALLADSEGLHVYVVENDTARRRTVTVNYRDGSIVGIASGLSGGEAVIRSGGGQLHDGLQVRAVSEDWTPSQSASD